MESDACKKQGESASDRPTQQRRWVARLVYDVGITDVEAACSCDVVSAGEGWAICVLSAGYFEVRGEELRPGVKEVEDEEMAAWRAMVAHVWSTLQSSGHTQNKVWTISK